MFRAMAIKELRETVWIVLLVLGAIALLFHGMLGDVIGLDFLSRRSYDTQNYVPFVQDELFYVQFLWVCGLVTLALGFRQTLGESIHHTYPFLFHRPAGRRWLIGMKLLVGLGLYFALGATLILTYGLWAATPGKHASPFEWSMTVPAWAALIEMTPLYLGAFLSGIRPGRWFGTRLLPLVAVAPTLMVAMADAFTAWSVMDLAIICTVDALFIVTILFVAQTRDYS
jgi:hypothetical protein